MKFTLEIELGNDEMRTRSDISKALAQVRSKLYAESYNSVAKIDGGKIMDINGNTVGKWEIGEPAAVLQHIATDNDERIYWRGYGKDNFRVRAITTTVNDANAYMLANPGKALIGCFGPFNIIAEKEETKVAVYDRKPLQPDPETEPEAYYRATRTPEQAEADRAAARAATKSILG